MTIEQTKMNTLFIRQFRTPVKVEPQSRRRYRIKHEKSFHKSMAFVLILAQCFGQLPIQGITSPDVKALHFKWKSWRTLYSVLVCVGATFLFVMKIISLLARGMNLFEISKLLRKLLANVKRGLLDTLVFNLCGLATTVLFLDLARNWPGFMREWVCVERSMIRYGWPSELDVRLKAMTVVFMSIAAGIWVLNCGSLE